MNPAREIRPRNNQTFNSQVSILYKNCFSLEAGSGCRDILLHSIPDQFRQALDAQIMHHSVLVIFDCFQEEIQNRGNIFAGITFYLELQHFTLAGGEASGRICLKVVPFLVGLLEHSGYQGVTASPKGASKHGARPGRSTCR
jgi:hypothetical protein